MSTNARILAAWQAITAAVRADTISVSFRATTIGLIAELGQFVEVLFKTDDVGLTDAQKQAFYKVSVDTYSALDKYIATVAKPRADAYAVTDQQYAEVAKAITDVSTLLDEYKASIHKPFYEQITGLEDYVYVFAKKAPENFVNPVDTIANTTTKPRFDDYSVSDDDVVEFTKDRNDGGEFTDYRYAYIEKVLTDSVNTTDDIDGAASIDDDQEVQFFKVIGELTATQDEFYRFMAFVRAFSEEVGFSDTSYNQIDKPFAEMVTGVEDHAYVLSRKTPDSPTVLEDLAVLTSEKPLNEEYSVTDDEVLEFGKYHQELVTTSDNQFASLEKPFGDTTTLTDDKTFELIKALSEEFNVVDFLDQATIVVKRNFIEDSLAFDQFTNQFSKPLDIDAYSVGDVVALTAAKNLAELAFWSEMLYRLTNKTLTDDMSVSESKAISAVKPTNDGFSLTDSGGLRSQSYCDFTYIAEDYVGESRTF